MREDGGRPGSGARAGSVDVRDPGPALRWRLIGPHRGGRVVAVAGHPDDPMVFYFGACAGGVWKTVDGGTYWENVSDGFFGTAAVGALAVAPSDPNVIYAGTGETAIRGNVSHGDGVYRSTDGGKTWRNMGLAATRHIARIRVHPRDPNLLYVAALGHAWGPNPERGLYRSRDGGETWEQILGRGDRAGAVDLSMDPSNPRALYAAFWEAQRTPHSLSSGGQGSGLFRSTDGGDTWTELTNRPGLPGGLKGKIGVAVSPARPGRVWALIEAADGALFRSDDGGETWQRLSEQGTLRTRAWYYMHVFADPQDAETVWVLNYQCWRSTDGGRTFADVQTPHGDNHDLWIDPRNPLRMIEGNDGGACVSFNGGISWSTLLNQPTAQLYHVIADQRVPYRLYASQQDNTAISVPSRSARGAITPLEWYEPGGGESGYIAVDPQDPDIVYGGAIGSGHGNGRLIRYDHRTGQERNVTIWPETTGMGDGAKDLKYRFQWTFPLLFSPHDPQVLYAAGNRLFRSTDGGANWEPISPDLTRNDPTRLEPSGGPITRDNSGAEVYCTIFAFVESPHQRGLFWAGTDDGLVHLSRDGGQSWEPITPPDLPEWALISVIEPSPFDPAGAYLAATRYKLDDLQPYLFKTADYGRTWQRITAGIAEHEFTRVVRADPVQRGLLFAGTETGVYVSHDDGASWHRQQGNLPVAPIHDLAIKDGDLIAATHGRSLWILDDLTALRRVAQGVQEDRALLIAPGPLVNYKSYAGYGYKPNEGQIGYRMAGPLVIAFRSRKGPDNVPIDTYLDAGENPPSGAVLVYYLPRAPEGEITLTLRDGQGGEIRRFSSAPPKKDAQGEEAEGAEKTPGGEDIPRAEGKDEDGEPRLLKAPGYNRFVWDLRHAPARKVPGDKSTEEMLAGPQVPPGRYEAVLQMGKETLGATIEVRQDPRVTATQEDLEAQHRLLLRIRDLLSETHDAINAIRDLRTQLVGWRRRIAGRAEAESALAAAQEMIDTLTAVEDALIQRKAESPLSYPTRLNEKLAALTYFVDSADAAPTAQQQAVFDDLAGRIRAELDLWRAVLDSALPAFNVLLRDTQLAAFLPPPVPKDAQ